MSKAKAQGTRHESAMVHDLTAHGVEARRLAEGGADDEGDVEAHIGGTRWVLEGKARQTLNVQATLAKARAKANKDSDTTVPVAVVWKRLVRVPGKQVRQPVAGERVVVVLSMEDFLSLIGEETPE